MVQVKEYPGVEYTKLSDGALVTRYSCGLHSNYCNNRRDRAPARILPDGTQEWYENGNLHAEGNMPAIIRANGKREYYRKGRFLGAEHQYELKRPDGTVVSVSEIRDGTKTETFRKPCGTIEIYKSGELTERKLPCGSQEEYKNDQLIRIIKKISNPENGLNITVTIENGTVASVAYNNMKALEALEALEALKHFSQNIHNQNLIHLEFMEGILDNFGLPHSFESGQLAIELLKISREIPIWRMQLCRPDGYLDRKLNNKSRIAGKLQQAFLTLSMSAEADINKEMADFYKAFKTEGLMLDLSILNSPLPPVRVLPKEDVVWRILTASDHLSLGAKIDFFSRMTMAFNGLPAHPNFAAGAFDHYTTHLQKHQTAEIITNAIKATRADFEDDLQRINQTVADDLVRIFNRMGFVGELKIPTPQWDTLPTLDMTEQDKVTLAKLSTEIAEMIKLLGSEAQKQMAHDVLTALQDHIAATFDPVITQLTTIQQTDNKIITERVESLAKDAANIPSRLKETSLYLRAKTQPQSEPDLFIPLPQAATAQPA